MRAGGTGDDRAFYFLPVSGLEGRYMLSWDLIGSDTGWAFSYPFENFLS